ILRVFLMAALSRRGFPAASHCLGLQLDPSDTDDGRISVATEMEAIVFLLHHYYLPEPAMFHTLGKESHISAQLQIKRSESSFVYQRQLQADNPLQGESE
ncbi:hypothetical protein KUCAC02_033694, partial [Chaenocephalus aceratus]